MKGGSKGVALLLLLTVLSAVEPLLLRFAAPPALGGSPAAASAAPISEEAFVRRLADWLETGDKFLKRLAKEAVEELGKAYVDEPLHTKLLYTVPQGKRPGFETGNLLARAPEDLEKAKQIIEELFQSVFLTEAEYDQAEDHSARKLGDVERMLGIPRSTARRITRRLRERGLVAVVRFRTAGGEMILSTSAPPASSRDRDAR